MWDNFQANERVAVMDIFEAVKKGDKGVVLMAFWRELFVVVMMADKLDTLQVAWKVFQEAA